MAPLSDGEMSEVPERKHVALLLLLLLLLLVSQQLGHTQLKPQTPSH